MIHSLVATDICTGWTEAVPLPARDQSLVRVDSGRGQNRTLRPLWPPVFAGEQDVGPPKG